jgi:hypothetical protein
MSSPKLSKNFSFAVLRRIGADTVAIRGPFLGGGVLAIQCTLSRGNESEKYTKGHTQHNPLEYAKAV